MSTETEKPEIIDESGDKYKYGFVTDIASDSAPMGLNEDIIRFISAKKGEPDWLLEWRLQAFRFWQKLEEPTWAKLHYDKIDYQSLHYYAAPKQKVSPKSLDEVDPELLATYEKLGIPLKEQEALAGVVAVDAVFDSVSVATTYRAKLAEQGIIFCSISEAVKHHPDLVRRYLGSVVPYTDNFFACLNSAVFTDGSFVYIPKGVRCPMELSTYFRINAKNTGQFERCILQGDNSVGEFYSVAITNNLQQADTGTKMLHIGKNTTSKIISKGISAGRSNQTYRGLVKVSPHASGARNYSQCDSLLIGDSCGSHTVPYVENRNKTARLEHEATTSKISDEQLFYCRQRGIGEEEAVSLIVNGFCKEVMQHLPLEFAIEAAKLINISLEGSVG